MAPDGGWGWMVVLSSFLLHFIIDGISYAFGVLAADLVGELGSTRQLNGWIASAMVGVTLAGGPVASVASARFGHRAVAMAGSVVAAAGFAASYFVDSAWALIGTVGLLVGFGMSLIYLPAIICVGIYFEKYRSTAMGIAVCGAGVGTLAFSPLISYLLGEYTWRGTMLILSAAVLQCAVFAALLRPLEPTLTAAQVQPASDTALEATDSAEANSLPVPAATSLLLLTSSPSLDVEGGRKSAEAAAANFLSVQDVRQHRLTQPHGQRHRQYPRRQLPPRQKQLLSASLANVSRPAHYVRSITSIASATALATEAGRTTSLRRALGEELSGFCRADLLTRPAFLLFLLSNLLSSIGFNAPYLYTPDRAQVAGHAETDSALLVSVIGASNMAGRLGFGWLSDRGCVSRLRLYWASLVVAGTALMLSCLSDGYAFSAACCAAFGLFSGTFVTLTSPVLVDLLGIDRLSDSFGLTLLFQGVGVLAGPPLAGLLYDWTASFDVPFLVCGLSLVGSGLVMVPVHWLDRASDDTGADTQEL